MEMAKRGFVGAMLVLAMAAAAMLAMPAAAYADDLFIDNASQPTGSSGSGDNWTYDADTTTLTLSGADIRNAKDSKAGIYYKGTKKFTLVLEGSNTIDLSGSDAHGIETIGADLTIEGTGSLTVKGGAIAKKVSSREDICRLRAAR